MRVTERHLALIRWMNGFGAVTTRQLSAWLNVDFSTGADLARRLIEAGLLRRAALPFFQVAPLIPTADGCTLANDSLAPLKGIRAATWPHDNALADLAPKLAGHFGGIVEPERRIRWRHRLNGEAPSHSPDLVVHRTGRRALAVELELSQKTPTRIQAILDQYVSSGQYERVLYLAGNEKIARYIKRFIEPFDLFLVKVYRTAAPAPVSAPIAKKSKSEGGQSGSRIA